MASQAVPLGLDYPYWIDDPDFDLEYHVREIALAPPPTDAKLAEQVARIFARPLDRARPLWEAYLIHGLADGNVALLTKIHHSAVDGISGAEIMSVLRAAKELHQALPAQLLQDATQFIPPAVFARAARVTFSLAATRTPVWNLVVSNVPGPQFPLYCAGARIEANYPVPVITDGMGLNITVMSYCGHLDFGIVADREQMRDVWKLIGGLSDSLQESMPADAAAAAREASSNGSEQRAAEREQDPAST